MSKFECPRCGSGIKPNDLQCDRCGEMLRKVEARRPKDESPQPPVVVRRIYADEQTEVHLDSSEMTSVSKVRKTLEEKEKELLQREKVLADKERRMQDTFDKMEADQNQLEESYHIFETDQASLRNKEGALRERQMETDRLSQRFEEGLIALLELEKNVRSQLSEEDTRKLEEIKSHYGRAENSRLRQLEAGFAEKLADKEVMVTELATVRGRLEAAQRHIVELERKARMAPSPLTVGEQMQAEEEEARADEEERVAELVRQVGPDLDSQIGTGLKDRQEMVIHTHIDKLDVILGGGIPEGHVILVNGAPGTMKSTLTYTILHNAALKDGLNSMYFSLEQNRESILRQMARLKMPDPQAADRVMVVDMVDLRKKMQDIKGDWREILLRYVKNVFAERPFRIFVLDSLDSFKAMASYEFTRQDLKDLFDWFKSLGITVLLVSESSMDHLLESPQSEMYLADGTIELIMRQTDESKVQRWMRCPKMRGMNVDTRYYSFFHDGARFSLSIPIVDS